MAVLLTALALQSEMSCLYHPGLHAQEEIPYIWDTDGNDTEALYKYRGQKPFPAMKSPVINMIFQESDFVEVESKRAHYSESC